MHAIWTPIYCSHQHSPWTGLMTIASDGVLTNIRMFALSKKEHVARRDGAPLRMNTGPPQWFRVY